MKKIAIIGYGRFGALLAQRAEGIFEVCVVETSAANQKAAQAAGYAVVPLTEISLVDYIFLAVPISAVDATLQAVKPFVSAEQVVIDLCSVKVYPVMLMQHHLPQCQLLGAHPMFGPDSARKGLKGLQVALCPVRISDENFEEISNFWTGLGCEITVTTPEAHDQDSVYSQAFTYSIARIILNMNIPDITFDTRSYRAITEVATLSANDSEQLFHDMLYYNPYFETMKLRLQNAITMTMQNLDAISSEQHDTARAAQPSLRPR